MKTSNCFVQSVLQTVGKTVKKNPFKVIPLKKKEYLEFSKTWSSSYLYYEYYKNAIKNGGHRARFCVTWMAIMINI